MEPGLDVACVEVHESCNEHADQAILDAFGPSLLRRRSMWSDHRNSQGPTMRI